MTKLNYSANREKPKKTLEKPAHIPAASLDSMDHPYIAQKNLVLGISANVGIFLIVLLMPRLILLAAEEFDFAEFHIVTVPASIIMPYAAGFLIGYSAIKLFWIYCSSGNTNTLKIDSGMMSGYSKSQSNSEKWSAWLFASLCGFLNLIVFTISLDVVKKLL